MGLWAVLVLGLGLALDCFAVAVTEGAVCRKIHLRHAVRMAGLFALFQGGMPLLGALAGAALRGYIAAYDHWVAFGLLGLIGAKMIHEGFKFEEYEEGANAKSLMLVVTLAVATSIDALVVGVTLSLLGVGMLRAAGIIAGVTFVVSLAGVALGKRFGHMFEKKTEIVAGLVLIGLGTKILIEHLIA